MVYEQRIFFYISIDLLLQTELDFDMSISTIHTDAVCDVVMVQNSTDDLEDELNWS
jgi:hypothetical protein